MKKKNVIFAKISNDDLQLIEDWDESLVELCKRNNATPECVSSLISRGFNKTWIKIELGENDD